MWHQGSANGRLITDTLHHWFKRQFLNVRQFFHARFRIAYEINKKWNTESLNLQFDVSSYRFISGRYNILKFYNNRNFAANW
jgi:uncharacterized protein (UPF0303 family)